MQELIEVKALIESAVQKKEMLIVLGDCFVEYWGRAASKLGRGRRMLLIKADGSFAIHQNKHLRPVNYMMNASISCSLNKGNELEVIALKRNPKESLKAVFYSIDFIKSFELEDKHDLRLFGSEAELSKQLSEDLDFIEPGLKPLKKEQHVKKGTIDILAEDRQGRIVVVEVKRRKASLDSVSQLHRYAEELKKIKSRETRGILLAPSITDSAHSLLHDYGLEFFKLDFEIGNPSAKIKGLEKKQKRITAYIEKKHQAE